ncbi:MAG: phospholipid carrier-dependent glycosyltransferase [Chloroflexota bacterium]|nr:phospholipid carrier-dependent glycosyltransferase [Chloroflexota bacterium]
MTHDSVVRRGTGNRHSAQRVDAVTALIALLALGLLLRVVIAGVYLPLSGFRIDVNDFASWAGQLARHGPAEFYANCGFCDYPPGYMFMLWFGGVLAALLPPGAAIGLVKVPGILADVGVAWLLFIICRRWGGELIGRAGARRGLSGETLGLTAAAIYLFNPGTLFDAAVWGQIDSVGTLVLVATIYLLARGRTEAAAVGAVAAMLIKFQFAFAVPIVAVVGIKRHLAGRSTDPELDARREPVRVLTSLAAGLATLAALILPFRMGIWSSNPGETTLVSKFLEAAGTYPGLSINAFNLWRNPWSGLGNTNQWGDDTTALFSVAGTTVDWRLVGTLLFVGVALVALWLVVHRDDLRGLLIAALLVAVAFFVLPTRVHERYLFPALALAAPLVLRRPAWAVLYGIVSLSFFANVYWAYTADWSYANAGVLNPGAGGGPMARDPFLAATVLSDAGIYLLAAAAVATLAWLIWRSLRLCLASDLTAEPMAADDRSPPPAALARDWAGPDLDPVHEESRAQFVLRRIVEWLRPDPADPYLREPGRRLDRRDAAIVAGLVVLAFGFRLWHLDVPRGMCCFDEIYHARSATEWLSDWEHGWTRDVYEWTHPMLAKYLIAAGIVITDPNKVVGEATLDAPVTVLAVAPARTSVGHPHSVAFGASGAEIAARDLATGQEVARWPTGSAVASLAYDEDNARLLVGLASSGSVAAYDLNAFLARSGPRGPPPAAAGIAFETHLSSVDEIVVASDASLVLVRGRGGIAALELVSGAPLAESALAAAGIGYVKANGDLPSRVVITDLQHGAIVFLDSATLAPKLDAAGSPTGSVQSPVPLIGPLVVRESEQQVFALTGAQPENNQHPAVPGGLLVIDGSTQSVGGTGPLPGVPTALGWDSVGDLMHAAGTDAQGATVLWTIEPHLNGGQQSAGLAVYDSTPLPAPATALAFDVSKRSQADDHGHLLVAAGTRLATVDVGSNPIAWRMAGIAFGSALVALIYLLAATMFRRRRIAVLAGLFVAFDAMSYVMSRIAMNDIFAAVFIVAAYLLFWQIWSHRWRHSAWWALPAVGVLIGLAAATKWVGFYALAGLWVLVLARTALGRLVLLAGIAFLAVVAGIGAPWPFTVLMLAGLALALVLVHVRPIRLGPDDLRLALPASGVVAGGIGLALALGYGSVKGRVPNGAVELIFSYLSRAAQAGWPALVMISVAGLLLLLRAVRSLRDPESDARWYQPAALGGFAWPWVGASLLIVPLVVYGLTYLPYLWLGHSWALPDTGPGYGWSVDELQAQMFGYHFGLQSGHVASSPWWSWPLDLKTVWFFSADYDGGQLAVIYNGGNPILFWAGIPAVLLCALLAWKRRSPALVMLVAAFAFQYLPWTRIERATFQYHYLTAVTFTMVAIAYLVDEALRRWALRDLAIGFLVLAVVAGVLIFPLGYPLSMPDWYINALRSLPPWNFYFKFPDPPQGSRAALLSVDLAKLVVGLLVMVAAVAFALKGGSWPPRRRGPHASSDDEVPEAGPA